MTMNLKALKTRFKQVLPHYQFIGLESVASTSGYLKECYQRCSESVFCITNDQTDGYGQRGREWLSNEDSLTFSFLCHVPVPLNELDGFSQLISLALVDSLNVCSKEKLYIKWPNDLYSCSGKVAGLLIESVQFDEHSCSLVIGIGINFSSIDEHKISLNSLGNRISCLLASEENKVSFLLCLMKKIEDLTSCFKTGLFSQYLEEYQKNDYFDLDQKVIVYDTGQSIYGRYKSLTQRGELLFESEGNMMTYRSGNVSIRAMNDI